MQFLRAKENEIAYRIELLIRFGSVSALIFERYLYSAHRSPVHEIALITGYQIIESDVYKIGDILFLIMTGPIQQEFDATPVSLSGHRPKPGLHLILRQNAHRSRSPDANA